MKTILLTLAFLAVHGLWAQARGNESDTVSNKQIQQVRATAFEQYAPEIKTKAKKGEWNLGGSFGMAFGNRQTTLSFAPQIGYNQNPYFTVGGGLTYSYYHSSKPQNTLHYMGINLYGEVTPLPFLSFRLQPELYEGWGKSGGQNFSATLIPTILVGGGIRLPLIKGSVSVMFYYDVLQFDNTPYGDNVFYTIGYSFSL